MWQFAEQKPQQKHGTENGRMQWFFLCWWDGWKKEGKRRRKRGKSDCECTAATVRGLCASAALCSSEGTDHVSRLSASSQSHLWFDVDVFSTLQDSLWVSVGFFSSPPSHSVTVTSDSIYAICCRFCMKELKWQKKKYFLQCLIVSGVFSRPNGWETRRRCDVINGKQRC